MSKKTVALIISLVILTAALLAIALSTQSPSQNPNDIISKNSNEKIPTPTPVAQTTLSLSPNPYQATTGANEIKVLINSESNKITTAQVELAYDPKLITNVKITKGEFLTNAVELLNKNDATTGRLSFALGLLPAQPARSGTGVVATISFNARPATTLTKDTELTLLDKSLVTASGVSPSVLKEVKSTKIILPSGNTLAPNVNTQVSPTPIQ